MWKDLRSARDDLTLYLEWIEEAKGHLDEDCLYRSVSLYPADLLFLLWEYPEWKKGLFKKEVFCFFCPVLKKCGNTKPLTNTKMLSIIRTIFSPFFPSPSLN